MQTTIQTVSFKTLGCRLNQAETDALEVRLRERGYRVRKFGEPVDLTVINTCTVTGDADRDSRYAIRQAVKKSQGGRVVVTGCYAQMSPEAVRTIDGVDLVLGNHEKYRLIEFLDHVRDGKLKEPIAFLTHGRGGAIWSEESLVSSGASASRTRASLKIQDGCDYVCSFCIIPFARGRARSRPQEDVLKEADAFIDRGFREIVLTGVNIGTYYDRTSNARFADLLDKLSTLKGQFRLRISSIEPNTVTTRVLRLMAEREKICPHLHMPIQSGSDPILAVMRRKYRRARLERLANEFHKLMPEGALGTDVVVGFPGETDRDFRGTRRLVQDAAFSYLHVFPFSARAGTAASKLSASVPPEVVHDRASDLRTLSSDLWTSFARRFEGHRMPVLFEDSKEDLCQEGLTPNYLRVRVSTHKDLRGQVWPIRLGALEDASPLMTGVLPEMND
ncbi:MAG TPA: tRNA (N(6)-L-threonylcarbamoyladenosine(37)-C(2))-methylthiotransferase MtaB [bacterium]|nr:tRNA (N(6)-L-threonylcarbamoyladenosine(37)-C(2))-methylthiotransferase MtaB [bacterium]